MLACTQVSPTACLIQETPSSVCNPRCKPPDDGFEHRKVAPGKFTDSCLHAPNPAPHLSTTHACSKKPYPTPCSPAMALTEAIDSAIAASTLALLCSGMAGAWQAQRESNIYASYVDWTRDMIQARKACTAFDCGQKIWGQLWDGLQPFRLQHIGSFPILPCPAASHPWLRKQAPHCHPLPPSQQGFLISHSAIKLAMPRPQHTHSSPPS